MPASLQKQEDFISFSGHSQTSKNLTKIEYEYLNTQGPLESNELQQTRNIVRIPIIKSTPLQLNQELHDVSQILTPQHNKDQKFHQPAFQYIIHNNESRYNNSVKMSPKLGNQNKAQFDTKQNEEEWDITSQHFYKSPKNDQNNSQNSKLSQKLRQNFQKLNMEQQLKIRKKSKRKISREKVDLQKNFPLILDRSNNEENSPAAEDRSYSLLERGFGKKYSMLMSPTMRNRRDKTSLSLKKVRTINKSQLCETGQFSRLDETQNFTSENAHQEALKQQTELLKQQNSEYYQFKNQLQSIGDKIDWLTDIVAGFGSQVNSIGQIGKEVNDIKLIFQNQQDKLQEKTQNIQEQKQKSSVSVQTDNTDKSAVDQIPSLLNQQIVQINEQQKTTCDELKNTNKSLIELKQTSQQLMIIAQTGAPQSQQKDIKQMMQDTLSGKFKAINMKQFLQQKKPDLMYLYSEPLVSQIMSGEHEGEYISQNQVVLNKCTREYTQLLKHMESTGKELIVQKQTMNVENLRQIFIEEQPKILHLSCQTDYNIKREQMFIKFERPQMGTLECVHLKTLKEIFSQGKLMIDLIVVNSCNSNEISKMLLQCGIPGVISINMHDSKCDQDQKLIAMFQERLYANIFDGQTLEASYKEALSNIGQSDKDGLNVCCCAHKHTADCKWYQYALDYGFEQAHLLHSRNCKCNLPLNKHKWNCNILRDFQQFESHSQNVDQLNQEIPQSPTTPIVEEDSSSINLSDGSVEMVHEQAFDDKVLCCCSSQYHDETIKFSLNVSDESVKDLILFSKIRTGKIRNISHKNVKLFELNCQDTNLLIGRHKEIQECVRMLMNDEYCRLIQIYGDEKVGKQAIGKYSVNYCVDRDSFEDGIFALDLADKHTEHGFESMLFKTMGSCKNLSHFTQINKEKKIVLIIYNCNNILEHDKQHFSRYLIQMIEKTVNLKILLQVHSKQSVSLPKKYNKDVVHIGPLDAQNAVKYFKALDDHNQMLKFYDVKSLQDHRLFSSLHSHVKLGEIYERFKILKDINLTANYFEMEDKKNMQDQECTSKSICNEIIDVNQLKYVLINLEKLFKHEINVILLLCSCPTGYTEKDLKLVIQNDRKTDYGKWQKFLNTILHMQIELQKKLDFEKIQEQENNQIEENPMDFFYKNQQEIKQQQQEEETLFLRMKLIYKEFDHKTNQEKFSIRVSIREKIMSYFKRQQITFKYGQNRLVHFNFQSLIFIAKYARTIMVKMKQLQNSDPDIHILSNLTMQSFFIDQFQQMQFNKYQINMSEDTLEKIVPLFNSMENNFIETINSAKYKKQRNNCSQLMSIDNNKQMEFVFEEILISYATILVMCKRKTDSMRVLEDGIQACQILNLTRVQLKGMLMLVSLQVQAKCEQSHIETHLKQIQELIDQYQIEVQDNPSVINFLKADFAYLSVIYVAEKSLHRCIRKKKMEWFNVAQDFDEIQELQNQSKGTTKQQSAKNENHKVSFNKKQTVFSETMGNMQAYLYIQMKLNFVSSVYKQSQQDLCWARAIIVKAEFSLDDNCSIGVSLSHTCKESLMHAGDVFKKYECFKQALNCIYLRSKLEIRTGDLVQAKLYALEALSQSKSMHQCCTTKKIQKLFDSINRNIHRKTFNLIWWLNSNPVVYTDQNGEMQEVGQPLNMATNDFSEHVTLNVLNKLKKEIKIRKNILTVKNLEYIKNYGCRILVLFSSMFDGLGNMIVEKENGELMKLDKKELTKILKPNEEDFKLNINVVFVNIVNGQSIANIFKNFGVEQVFTYAVQNNEAPQKLSWMQLAKRVNQDNKVIEDTHREYMRSFTLLMIERLVNENTFFNSYHETIERLSKVNTFNKGPKLSTKWVNGSLSKSIDKLFDKKLYYDKQKLLSYGQIRNESENKNNIQGFQIALREFKGRKVELHKILKLINDDDIKVINIHGQSHCGKTSFVKELAKYLCNSHLIQNKIIYHDFKEVKQMKDCIEFINSNQCLKGHVYILDSVDSIVNDSTFLQFVAQLFKQTCHMKVIFTQQKEQAQNNMHSFLSANKMVQLNLPTIQFVSNMGGLLQKNNDTYDMILKNHIILESKMVVDVNQFKKSLQKIQIQKSMTTMFTDLIKKFEPNQEQLDRQQEEEHSLSSD